jgi:anti-repressor protein
VSSNKVIPLNPLAHNGQFGVYNRNPISQQLPFQNAFGGMGINARDLHTYLGSQKDFSNWFKSRVKVYGFEDGKDFVTARPFGRAVTTTQGGGHNVKDYLITMNMAKELAMVERTLKGKQARQWFMECEKLVLSGISPQQISNQSSARALPRQPTTPQSLLGKLSSMVTEIEEDRKLKNEQLDTIATKLREKAKKFGNDEGDLLITDAAKHVGRSTRAFKQWLIDMQWVYRRGNKKGVPTSRKNRACPLKPTAALVDLGYLTYKLVLYYNQNGDVIKEVNTHQVMVTEKGIYALIEIDRKQKLAAQTYDDGIII